MTENSRFFSKSLREPRAVRSRQTQKNRMGSGGRTKAETQVAIDGNCTRINADRMMVRTEGIFAEVGWHRDILFIVPKNDFSFFGIFWFKEVIFYDGKMRLYLAGDARCAQKKVNRNANFKTNFKTNSSK